MKLIFGALFPLIMLGVGIVFALIVNKNKRPFVENAIRWILFFSVGIVGLWGGAFQALDPEMVAASIGWSNSPFLFEVACLNLGCGLAGILALWFGREYWLSLTIVQSVFLWGAAFGHIKQMVLHHNFAINNAGPILYTDILVPLILLILLAKHYCRVCRECNETSL